jgi:hypothetical protein
MYDSSNILGRIERLQLSNAKLLSGSKDQLKAKQTLSDLRWYHENLERQLEVEIFLECHEAVVAVHIYEGEKAGGNVAVRVLNAMVLFVDVESSYLRKLLTAHSYMMPKYRLAHAWINKYHRRETFDATTFFQARKLNDKEWEVKDVAGATVTVTANWAQQKGNIGGLSKQKVLRQYDIDKDSCCNTNTFVKLEDGSRTSTNLLQPPCNALSTRIKYRNVGDEEHCVVKALASAMHTKGDTIAAASIVSQVVATTKKCISGHQHIAREGSPTMLLIQDALSKHNLKLGRMSGRRGCRRAGKSHQKRSRITDVKGCAQLAMLDFIVLASLRGKTNGVLHCVAFYDGLMFDPNATTAAEVTSATLDRACGGSGYGGLVATYRLKELC